MSRFVVLNSSGGSSGPIKYSMLFGSNIILNSHYLNDMVFTVLNIFLSTDMPLYGLCPARDEFYLVVCECCEQVVKPQALKRHIGKEFC